jgi:glucose-1-phosphatase
MNHSLHHKLYIFDMGNVILSNVYVNPEISRKLGITLEAFNSFYAEPSDRMMIGNLSPEGFWAEYTQLSGTVVKEDLLKTCFNPVENRAMNDLLTSLRSRGARVVCGTNTYESHYSYMEKSGVFDHFDAIYASHIMGIAKPDVEFYQHILDSEKVQAEDAFFTDDLEVNIIAAKSIGIHAYLFTDRDSLTSEML